MSFLYFILIGGIAGWLAGQVMRGKGFGIIMNILLGILGGVVGGWLFDFLGLASKGGTWGSFVVSFVGAVAVLFVAGLFKRK